MVLSPSPNGRKYGVCVMKGFHIILHEKTKQEEIVHNNAVYVQL